MEAAPAAALVVEPPNPLNTVAEDVEPEVPVAVVEAEVVVVVPFLTATWAPQGLSWRQAEAQVLSWPHWATHWFWKVWHSKKGIVRVNSEALGERPLPQIQEKSRVVGSQVFAVVEVAFN